MYNNSKEGQESNPRAEANAPKEIFAAPTPYPPVQVCERNSLYGRMMLDNVGGQNSEMSAVSLYLYNNLLIDEDTRLSNIFKGISIVEMHHLHIFGQIARLMGETPRLWTHQGNKMRYWSPGYNKYFVDLKPLFLDSIQGERMAVQKYQNQCEQIKDNYIVACLKRIIIDEELHIKLLESFYEEYCC